MKVTLGKLYFSYENLVNLSKERKFTSKQKFMLSRLLESVAGHLNNLEKTRLSTIEKFKEEKGENWDKEKPNLTQFVDEFNELLQEEIEVPGTQLKLSDLPDEMECNALDITRLSWLIVEE